MAHLYVYHADPEVVCGYMHVHVNISNMVANESVKMSCLQTFWLLTFHEGHVNVRGNGIFLYKISAYSSGPQNRHS